MNILKPHMSGGSSRNRRSTAPTALVAFLSAACCIGFASAPGSANPLSFTPDVARNSANLEGLIPFPKLGTVTLPKGNVELEDGTLAVTVIPEFNFDRVPVLKGPIIRTEVTTAEREAIVSGVVLFTDGYWYTKFWPTAPLEQVVTTTGATINGRIMAISATALSINDSSGNPTEVSLADIKEIHSPRAYAFAIPALASSAITPAQNWTADARSLVLTPTVTAPNYARTLNRDSLLAGDGDWRTSRLIVLGTALSLVEVAQFTPELVLPQFSHQLWQHANKKSFFTNTNGGQFAQNFAPLQPNGNTYNITGAAALGPIPSPVLVSPAVAPILTPGGGL